MTTKNNNKKTNDYLSYILKCFFISTIMVFAPYKANSAQLNLNTNPNPPVFTGNQIFSGNTGSGTAGYGVFVSTLNTGNVDLSGYTLESSGNLYGFNALTGGIMNIMNGEVIASNNKNAAGNSGFGIYANGVNSTDLSNIIRSTINMNNITSLTSNSNGLHGVNAEAGAEINISGSGSGSNFKSQNNKNILAAGTWNNGSGIYANSANTANVDDIKQSTIEIKNFDNINLSDNGLYGVYANIGGNIIIEGATSDSAFVANGNKNKTGVDGGGADIWTNGFGVYANGSNSINPDDIRNSTVSITNVKTFDASQNGLNGVAAGGSGKVIIGGTSSNDSVFNTNENITSVGTAGNGIFSTGANSSIFISGIKTINSNQNGLYGIHSAAGGSVTIEGLANGGSVFNAINNINTAGSNGAGIFSTGANSSVYLKNIEIFNSSQNGMYGISVVTGGSVNIEGTGTTVVNLTENKRTDAAVDGVGLYITGANSSVNISQVETFNASNNGKYGVYFYNSGATTTDITGNGSSTSSFNVNGNGGIGLYQNNANHTINLSGFKYYNFNDNGGAGFSSANSSAIFTIEGVSSGSEITASGNTGAGFTTSATSKVVLKNITKMEAVNNAGSGIVIGSNVTFEDMDQGISFISQNNTGTTSDGISINGTHDLLINTFLVNNNGRYGLAVIGGSTIFDMNGNVFNSYENGNNGLHVTASDFTMNNLSGLASTNNEGDGVLVTATGTLNLNGDASGAGLIVNNNSKIGFNGTGNVVFDNIIYFEAKENGSTGLKFTANNQFNGIDNGIGFVSENNVGTGIEIAGDHTFNKLTQFSINNNGIDGMHVLAGGSTLFNFDDYSISVEGNGRHGIYAQAGTLDLINIYSGIFSSNGASGLTTGGAAVVNIEGLSTGSALIAENNGGHGLFFSGSGTLKNINRIEANNNANFGFSIGANMAWDLDPAIEVSLIAVNNNTVLASNYYGMSISGVTIDNVVEMIATDNGSIGAALGAGAVINVTGNADFSNNVTTGLRLANGSTFNMDNTTNNINYFIANNTEGTTGMGVDVHGGTFNVNNVNMILQNQAYGIINWYSGLATITNTNFNITNNSYGILSSRATTNISSSDASNTIYAYDNTAALSTQEGGILNINNMNLYLEENDYGLNADFGGGEFNVTGNGSNQLVLKNNTYCGMNVLFDDRRPNTDGIMKIDNMIIIAEGNDLAKINGDGTKEESITIKNSTINMLTDDNLFATENYGTYVIDNVQSFGGGLLLNNTGTGVSEFSAFDSNLSGGIVTAGTSTSNVLFKDSVWNMKTSSNITSLENNGSMISIQNAVSGTYNNLTVNDYIGSNGKISINTFFDSIGTSTDRLIINGAATGNTVLYINGTGTDNTKSLDGIMVVDASNGTTSAGNFSLYGGVFDEYAYEYKLFRGDAGGIDENSFFLRATGSSSGADTAINIPALHLNIVKTGMNELRKRMGDIRNNRAHDNGLWVRTYAKHLNIDANIESKMNLFGFEAGYDRQINVFDENIYVGLMAGYIDGNDIKTYQRNGYTGSSKTETPSFGVYGTWLNDKGWFVDGTARYFQAKMNVTSYSSAGNAIAFEPNRNFIALSLEAGRTMKYNGKNCSVYIVEPKFELQYAHSKNRTFSTNAGYDVHYGETQSFVTQAGLLLGYEKISSKKQIFTPFVEFNISQEWDGKTDLKYAGSPFKSELQGISFGISTGLNAKLSKNSSIYSDIAYENGEITEAFSANLGFRYSF